MNYTFECARCGERLDLDASIKSGPPHDGITIEHGACGGGFYRVWTPPHLLLRQDPDQVEEKSRMVDTSGMSAGRAAAGGGMSKARATKKEKAYNSYIHERRKIFRDNKQVGGRMTHQVPVELYHAKIKQTGDKNYWKDPANLNRHTNCKVS